MSPRWSRIFSHISRISNLQRSSELVRGDLSVFPLRNYAKVAAAVEPNFKSDTNKPEVLGSRPGLPTPISVNRKKVRYLFIRRLEQSIVVRLGSTETPAWWGWRIHEETLTLQVNLNKMFWSKPCSLALATDSPNRIEDPQYEGVKRFILKLMLFYSKQSQFIRWANAIYHRVIYQVDRPAIYDVFSLEQTFKTTFSLLVLHMWLCLRRLKEEGKEGVELGQYLYEIYNHDLELRVSKAGVNLLLSKWMKELEKIFYGNIVAYDAAMGKQDDLQNVIWRNVFSDDGASKPSEGALLPVQASSYLLMLHRLA
ncbi:UNVERIFIED_CONTAM: Ubiquinol-cytochrome-c reductase complex assembly factor 1 [Sesamum indicum]